jgi:hypothetical protein
MATGGAGQSTDAGSIASDPALPLLEREASTRYTCTVSRAAAKLGINPWNGDAVLMDVGSQSYLARGEGEMLDLTWSSIDLSGKLGSRSSVRMNANSYFGGIAGVVHDGSVVLAWGEGDAPTQLWLAQVTASGAIAAAPHRLTTGTADERGAPRMVKTADGAALLYVETADATARLRLAFVDGQGALLDPSKVVVEGSTNYQANDLVATPSGFGLVYSSFDREWTLHYRALDGRGNTIGEATTLVDGTLDGRLLARGNAVLAAWTVNGEDENSKRHGIIRVARIDASSGTATTYDVQRPVIDQANSGPRWVDMGADVGLMWGRGQVIYICGGCYPDDALQFIVLDGSDLTPKSGLLSVPSPVGPGLTRAELVRHGDDILVVASITYHVSAEAASATLHCSQ